MNRSALPLVLWSVGPRSFGRDLALGAGLTPALFEAGAVVGEDAFDGDSVLLVEALSGGQEADRRCVGLIRVDRREREPGRVVDRDEQVLPPGATFGSSGAVACDAVTGNDDPAELLHVDVDELARPLALVADESLAARLARL